MKTKIVRSPAATPPMHELSIATAIMERILEFAQAQQAKQVLSVRCEIGELTHLQTEQLQFCFAAIVKDTPIADAVLEIEQVQALVKCPHCSYEGPPKYWDEALSLVSVPTLQCPECDGMVEVSQGHECAIQGVKFVR